MLFTALPAWDSLTLVVPMSLKGDAELTVPAGSVELAKSVKIMLEMAIIDKISTGMVLQRSIFDILNRLYSVVRGNYLGLICLALLNLEVERSKSPLTKLKEKKFR